ncbi:MAG: glycosyltransferase [Anaerolineae bacterium]|nr:glycosyltransferase [Anaerolineae bacterium]
MKVLVITEQVPSRFSGGAARQFNLIRELSRQHEFTVICPVDQTDRLHLQSLAPYVRQVEGIELELSPQPERSHLYWRLNALRRALFDPNPLRGRLSCSSRMRQVISRLLTEESFDLIQVHQTHLARLLPPTKTPTILDMHDILSDHEFRLMLTQVKTTHRVHAWLEWKKMQALERNIIRRFNACVTVSEHDQKSLLQLVPEAHVTVVPNGVDTDYFCPSPALQQGPNVTFVGSMRYEPNSDGVLWFYNAILPGIKQQVPDVHFYVVGLDPPPEIIELNDDPDVTVTGFVEDVRPYLANSAVCVVPIRFGSGTRLKILDAWSMQKAIVSTRLGAEGLEAVHSENILLADEPDQFAQYVVNLLSNPQRRFSLGQSGRQLVESRCSWSALAPKLGEVYETLQSEDKIVYRESF